MPFFGVYSRVLMTYVMNGRLAQLARALARQARGHWFKSSIAHHDGHDRLRVAGRGFLFAHPGERESLNTISEIHREGTEKHRDFVICHLLFTEENYE